MRSTECYCSFINLLALMSLRSGAGLLVALLHVAHLSRWTFSVSFGLMQTSCSSRGLPWPLLNQALFPSRAKQFPVHFPETISSPLAESFFLYSATINGE